MTAARAVLLVAAVGTGLIVAWLTFVLVAVVPARSPGSFPAWLAIDLVAIALVAASVAWLARGGAAPANALRLLGIIAAIVGAWLAATWIGTPAGADSDGYVLLIGAWLLAHGLVAVVAPGLPKPSLRTAP